MQGTIHNPATAGTLTLTMDGPNMTVTGVLTGFAPNSIHGLHIHAIGDISSPDGIAAGGHWNPYGQPHSIDFNSSARHAGDLV